MIYCLNPDCPQPKNESHKVCAACGSSLILRGRGNYVALKVLGQGGFGATFLAADLSLPGKPLCVIKQLRPQTNVPEFFKMAKELFQREAETLGRIGNHPQLPRLLDYFEDNQRFYLIQEYVRGHNLQKEVKQNGPFTEAGVKQFLSELLPMIQYIHAQGVIHRDIKPANLIRREEDKKLVLIDFGAVKNKVNLPDSSGSDQSALTQFAVGTPGFAPPEQMAMRPVFASDIYAIGVTCLYFLTARTPKDMDYNAATGEMAWQKYVSISDHFAQVLSKMLEISVRYRYQSAEEVMQAMEMEPYLDSLAQGLISKPTIEEQSSSDANNLLSSQSSRSATAKLAQQIRARKEANMGQTGFSTSVTRGLASSSSSASRTSNLPLNDRKKKLVAPATAEELLQAYARGRRDFAQQNFNGLNFKEANLVKINFHESRLVKANLEKANLANADLGSANLSQALMRDAILERTYLGATNLQNADLRGADLSFAYLLNANLKGTNLCGANLNNAKVTEEQLAQAKVNWRTIMPSGKRGSW
jgi:serine/threonine-protein kinase